MTCIKMPRSQCESDNVKFVQELAEVDGPFESPININFRDLTKVELPSLVWNRGDICPKKMKITNTGHTVIISGKWKCERPYLTGGPLTGKYVFSQIHFHWGQNDCKGSEHQVCGDGFPLEMHVAHFKTEYSTQECALREKDGMVVLVYLFKLQEEPNQNLKKIINLLPCIKEPSTSHAVDPRPILTLCKPFTDDYFMYWGSVVTSTCAHILLWIICREPFGISREQVNEFRKIMDSTHQPICRNSRDIQPLHKRNVFHVNASKHLDEPLLPVKNLIGCYCQGESQHASFEAHNCNCQKNLPNQEDVEGSIIEFSTGNDCLVTEGTNALNMKTKLPANCFGNQAIYVQRATVSVLLKRIDSEPVRNKLEKSFEKNGRVINLETKSCCFFPLNELGEEKKKGKTQQHKRTFNSLRGFSQIMHSLEVLKKQTIKKFKEIDSINQEIKGMKTLCQNSEDRRWLRNLEKMMRKQKRLTIKSSQGCLSELRKMAKDCNIFHAKALTSGDNNGKAIQWLYNDEVTKEDLPSKQVDIPTQNVIASVKDLSFAKDVEISQKAQKLIQSFFEDIHESDDLHETVKKDLQLKKMKSLCSKEAGDSNSVSSVIKGYITQNMFILGNLGDRFFKEVTADDFEINEQSKEARNFEVTETKIISENNKDKTTTEGFQYLKLAKISKESLIPLTKANVTVLLSKSSLGPNETMETLMIDSACFGVEEKSNVDSEISSDVELITRKNENQIPKKKSQILISKTVHQIETVHKNAAYHKLRKPKESNSKVSNVHQSKSILSTESNETQKVYASKFRRKPCRNDSWEHNSIRVTKKSSMSICDNSKKFESYYAQKKNSKNKKRKKRKNESKKRSSSSREDLKISIKRSKWKNLTQAKFHIKIGSDSSLASEIESSIISPKKKKLKLETQKASQSSPRENNEMHRENPGNEVVIKFKREGKKIEEKDLIKPNIVEEHSSKNEFGMSPRGSEDKLDNVSQNSSTKCYRSSSMNFKTKLTRTEQTQNGIRKPSMTSRVENETFHTKTTRKPAVKHKSLENLISSKEKPLFLEYLSSRSEKNQGEYDLKKKLKEMNKYKNDVQTFESNEEPEHRETNVNTQNLETAEELQFNIGFFTTTTKIVEEPLSENEIQGMKNQNTLLKRCDAEKYQFLNAKRPESLNSFQDGSKEVLCDTHQTGKSFTKTAFKSDVDPVNLNKDLQTSVSYLQLKKNPTSRSHSAETLHSLTKTFKRKSKKRPHCCKRNSKHYIRKNSFIFRKPNKTESKPLNSSNVIEEEQLKIISLNVAKYLQQKLEKEKTKSSEKTYSTNSMENILKDPQEKIKETTDAVKKEPRKQIQLPILPLTEKEKIKKKSQQTVVETKNKTKLPKSSYESQPEKSANSYQEKAKSVNDYTKINKEMTGKYRKRWTPIPKKQTESKEKEKHCSDAKKETGKSKFKTKIPKIRIQKNPVPKPQEQLKTSANPNSNSSPRNSNTLPAKIPIKNTRIKSPIRAKKKNEPEPTTIPMTFAKKEAKETVQKDELFKAFQKGNAHNEYFYPTTMLTSYLSSPLELVENQKRKASKYLLDTNNRTLEKLLPEVLYDPKAKMKPLNETLFKRELEYFIKLQLCLNDEFSSNVEVPMNYKQQSQDKMTEKVLANESQELNSFNNKITNDSKHHVLEIVKTKNVEDMDEDKKKVLEIKKSMQIADAGLKSSVKLEGKEESNSESSYDCKISITFNSDFSEKVKNAEREILDAEQEPNDFERNTNEGSYPRIVIEKTTSQTPLQSKRKKKDEISSEMKQKLLEIFEGEIRREVGMKYGESSGNSSEGFTSKLEDSDGNNKNQSSESSCDNIEILTQISDTMRQYLRDLNEKGELVNLIGESLNKKTEDKDAS